MSKIKKIESITDLSVYTKFTKDEGVFQVQARVYSMVSSPAHGITYDHDIQDIEIEFLINNKKVKHNGFKTLYNQLYGENTFMKYYDEKNKEFEEEYFKTTSYKTK